MRKIKFRGIYVAAVAGAIVGAAVGIPAWAASGGGHAGGGDSGEKGSADSLVPAPPPRGAFGLEMKGFPSAAEMRRARDQLDEFANCMREHGADIPGVHTGGKGVTIRVPWPEASAVMRRASKECGMPPPPDPHELLPLSRKQIEKSRKAIARGDCPALPPGVPRRK